jgi:hypothetical protein
MCTFDWRHSTYAGIDGREKTNKQIARNHSVSANIAVLNDAIMTKSVVGSIGNKTKGVKGKMAKGLAAGTTVSFQATNSFSDGSSMQESASLPNITRKG